MHGSFTRIQKIKLTGQKKNFLKRSPALVSLIVLFYISLRMVK